MLLNSTGGTNGTVGVPFIVPGLTADTAYNLTVRAVDDSNNESGDSNAPTDNPTSDSIPGFFYSQDSIMENGWVKNFRKIKYWEWYKIVNSLRKYGALTPDQPVQRVTPPPTEKSSTATALWITVVVVVAVAFLM